MNKSGKFKLCLLACLALSAAAMAVGCGEAHTHIYSDAWAFDAEAHWHPSACSHDTKTNKSAHSFTDTVIPPSATSEGYTLHTCACGYSYTSDQKDALPAETEYRYNEEGHWKPVLSEDGTPDVQPHECREETVNATCFSAGYTKHICECGYWYATDPTALLPHTVEEEVWEHSETAHWHPCLVCGAQVGTAAHGFDEEVTSPTCTEAGYTKFTCIDCGYSYEGRQTPAGHTFSDTLTGDEFEHWRGATCDHAQERTDVAEHVLIGRSNVCSVCGQEVSPRLAYAASADGQYYIVTGIGCIRGTEVEIPATYREKPVKEIAARAFAGEEVTSVTVEGNNLEKVGVRAFANTQIAEADLGTVSEIGQGAFYGCTLLQTASLGTVTAIPAYLFEGCSSLKTVNGSVKWQTVGAQAFSGCTELTGADLSTVTEVGFAAFSGCAAFAPASLGALTSAEEYAFSGCGVTAVTLPAGLKQVPAYLFEGCEKLNTVIAFSAEIGASAFANCTALGSVTLSGTVTVGESAFAGCSALGALTLPESVIRVGVGAFEGTGLISSEGGVNYAANVLIGADSGTQMVNVKAGTVGIADEAFKDVSEKGNTSLTSVTLEESVRFIGVSAFRGCKGLSAIEFKNVKVIGANAFRASGLVSVTVPATVDTVGDNAFYDCEDLTTVDVNAKEIGKFAFSYTGVGRDLSHPVKQRPSYAKLAQVTLGQNVKTIGSNAFQYAPITQITLPAGLTEIGGYAFAQTDLASVTIPSSVTRIGEYAFYGSKLTSAVFQNKQNWKAGKNSLTLGSDTSCAAYLTEDYVDYEWVRG